MKWNPLIFFFLFKLTNCKRNGHLWNETLLTSKTEGSQYLGLWLYRIGSFISQGDFQISLIKLIGDFIHVRWLHVLLRELVSFFFYFKSKTVHKTHQKALHILKKKSNPNVCSFPSLSQVSKVPEVAKNSLTNASLGDGGTNASTTCL